SLGLFKTGEVYMSPTDGNGLSMRLHGLSPTNRNAYKRMIVIHAQSYMEPEMIEALGVAGRSDGCMVFSSADRDTVVELLRGGAVGDGGEWDYDLQSMQEVTVPEMLEFDEDTRKLRVRAGPAGAPRHTVTMAISGTPDFCAAFREQFELG